MGMDLSRREGSKKKTRMKGQRTEVVCMSVWDLGIWVGACAGDLVWHSSARPDDYERRRACLVLAAYCLLLA